MNKLLLATLSFVLLAAQTAKADYSVQIPKDVQTLLNTLTDDGLPARSKQSRSHAAMSKKDKKPFSLKESFGEAHGSISTGRLAGTVEDKAKDGLCVQLITKWYNEGKLVETDHSPRTCPKGKKDNFTETLSDGKKTDSVTLALRTVKEVPGRK
jgi:hypothetical protein